MVGVAESELIEITRREVEKYAGVSDDAKAYPILDDTHRTYAVNGIMDEPGKDHAWIIVQARVVENYVIVDEDNVLDKNLIHALLQAGIPREQIILAYEGENAPAIRET
jgi:hypothetical protein